MIFEILRFYWEGKKRWYVDIPYWTGKKSALEMVSGADKLLDVIAQGRNEVYIHFSEYYINDSDVLNFKKKNWINGATYMLESFQGNKHNLKVWLCNVTLFVFGKFPQKIYFKEVDFKQTS